MKNLFKFTLLFLLTLPVIASAHAKYDGILVFGDSLSDTGKVPPLSKEGYHNKRWSNGKIWIDHLAKDLKLTKKVKNYAHAGAKTGKEEIGEIPNVGTQISRYLKESPKISPNTLVVIWAGILDAPSGNPLVPVDNIVNHIKTLQKAGAKHFIVPNSLPLNHYPAYNSTKDNVNQAFEKWLQVTDNEVFAGILDVFFADYATQIAMARMIYRDKNLMMEIKNKVYAKKTYSPTNIILSRYRGDKAELHQDRENMHLALNDYSLFYNMYMDKSLEVHFKNQPVNIHFLDVHSLVLPKKDSWLCFDDLHPNKGMHLTFAKQSLELLKTHIE